MKVGFMRRGSRSVAVALWATRKVHAKDIVGALHTGKRLQQTGPVQVLILILLALFAHASRAVTLQEVLQTTLEKNPAIQEARAGLEQAAGQRLVFRSIVWPDLEASVPAGLQY